MSKEFKKVLEQNIGKGVEIYFTGAVNDYCSGIIKEIGDEIVHIGFKKKTKKQIYEREFYVNISSIVYLAIQTPALFTDDGYM